MTSRVPRLTRSLSAALVAVALSGCSSPKPPGGVRSVTVGVHTDCPYGLVA